MISTAVLLTCTHYIHFTKSKQPAVTTTGGAKEEESSSATFVRMCVLMFGMVIGLTRVLISSHFVHQVQYNMAMQ